MPKVYTFSRSDSEILQELLNVFSTGRGTAREQWSLQAEMLVEPVGWDGLWKLSKDFCKRFEVRFPCIAYIAVTSVDFEQLTANVDVLGVQHEAVMLPEMVEEVPLIELWPTEKQREECINAAVTAEFIDLLRFFYDNIWMPWDDQDDKVLLSNTIEERMQLWVDLHNGSIPTRVARSIYLLRSDAIKAFEKLKEMDSSLIAEDLVDKDDSLLPPNYISTCAETHARLDALMSQWTIYENPLIREQYLANTKLKWQKERNKRNVVALWKGGSMREFDEMSDFLRSKVNGDQTLSVMVSAEEALALEPEEIVVCSEIYEIPEIPLSQISLQSYNGSTLKASGTRACLLMLSEECKIRDLTLQCRRVNTVLLVRGGVLKIQNCIINDDANHYQSEFAQGLVAMPGAKVLIEDCIFENFYSGIVVHKGAHIEIRKSLIKKCGVGIQMYMGATVNLDNTTIVDCSEHSVRCEVTQPVTNAKKYVSVEGLNIASSCKIGSGDVHREILVVQQDLEL